MRRGPLAATFLLWRTAVARPGRPDADLIPQFQKVLLADAAPESAATEARTGPSPPDRTRPRNYLSMEGMRARTAWACAGARVRSWKVTPKVTGRRREESLIGWLTFFDPFGARADDAPLQ